MTRITKVTLAITVMKKIRITVTITEKKSNSNINNDSNAATQVTNKTETISNRRH